MSLYKNIFKTAFRSLRKNKTISFINVFGLGVGLATCILLLLYIWDESSYDKHHVSGENLYRIGVTFSEGKSASSPAPMAEGMEAALPEIIQSTRLLKYPMLEYMYLTYETNGEKQTFSEANGYYVDSTFFDVFTYDFVAGSPHSALIDPSSLVLSSSLAKKIFGDKNPINEVITVGLPEGNFDYTVKGVFQDKDLKSHINANFFLSMVNNDIWNFVGTESSWHNNNMFHSYIKVQDQTDPEVLQEKMNSFFHQKLNENSNALGMTKDMFLQPVEDIYLTSDLGYEVGENGNLKYLYIFGSIGFFVLLIACINFMNLSTAKSEKRAREVGVRKVIGAQKAELVKQFLGESLMMSFIAFVLALLLLQLLLPFFNAFSGKSLQLLNNPLVIPIIFGLTLFTGFLAGIYPAFYLSSFRPVAIMKGSKGNSFSATAIRKGLVVFQFVISVGLIAMALVISHQMSFMQNTALGFDKEQQLVLSLQSAEGIENYTALKTVLESHQGVKSVTGASAYPGKQILQDWLLYPEGKTKDDVVDIYINRVANGYVHTLDLDLLSGRSFTADFTDSKNKMLLNQTAVKAFGYDETSALGKKLIMEWQENKTEYEIIGVVKDHHIESLHSVIKPLAFVYTEKPPFLIAKIQTERVSDILSFTEQNWKRINVATPFTYSFLDQDFQRNYEKEQKTAIIILYFTGVAIVISCIGLFGLAAFTAEQRTKEIGIRKVLGASTWNITSLVSREFLLLVAWAILIAVPLGYYAADRWLENFAYKINLSIWIFLISGLVAVFIAYGTVSFQAIKAALINPVDSLKSE